MLFLASVSGKKLMLIVGMIPEMSWCCVVLFIEGRTRGSLVALFTDQKVTNHESRISNFHFSFESYNQHVKYRFSSCSYAKKW